MGIGIGATSRATVSLSSAGLTQSLRPLLSSAQGEKPGQLVRPEEVPDIEAGFGENTLSPSGAALKTLDSNLKAAAQLVPTVEELRERARVAQAQREEAAATDKAPVEFRLRETVLPEPSPAVRNFFQDASSKTVDTADTSTTAPAAQAPEDGADVVQFSQPQPQPQPQSQSQSPQLAPSGSRLNIQA